MPPFDPRARYPREQQRIGIPSLSGGVGRRAPTKRQVNEAENLDNVLCTIERSVEKRPPSRFIQKYTTPAYTNLADDQYSTLGLPNTAGTADYFFHWLQISDGQRYLMCLDYSLDHTDPSVENRGKLIRVYRTSKSGFYETSPITVSENHYKYFTYGNTQAGATADTTLRAISVGPQLVILNTRVKAGYTSDKFTVAAGDSYIDGTGATVAAGADTVVWAQVDFDGDFKRQNGNVLEDPLGRELVYFTTVPVDPEGEASIYVQNKFYINNDQVFAVVGGVSKIYTCIQEGIAQSANPETNTGANVGDAVFALRSADDGGEDAKYIPVEDWDYPEASKAYLGQALEDFDEFNFPPRSGDSQDSAEGDFAAGLNKPPVDMTGKVTQTLSLLYDDIDSQGRGKVYSVENSYAGEPPGFYIVRDEDTKPYVRLIRTPDEYSVIDAVRFPKILKIESFDDVTDIEQFELTDLDLEERRSGNLKTNPGPLAFKGGKQVALGSMAFFRDRLFLSAGDEVFSSRTGDFSDFWVENPSLIVDTDPIDVRLSTNKYANVSTMTPFQQYLFINTGSDIQFTLQGSENTITPLNAVVSPTAFYSTSPLVDPVLLGSQIYFFAPRRSYIYFNDATVSVNQAVETSINCPGYLPENYGKTAVIPGFDTIAMLDQDNPKFVYMYTNRYSGAEVAQNAFFRYIYDTDVSYVQSFDNEIFYVMRYQYLENGQPVYRYYLEHQLYREPNFAVPLIDHQIEVNETFAVYDGSLDQTVITVPKYANLNCDTLYIAVDTEDELSGTVFNLASDLEDNVVVDVVNNAGTLVVTLSGNFTTPEGYRKFILGTSYTMVIEMSPQYVRDEGQNAIEGILSLRTLLLQHFNTGTYRVEKVIRGRRQTTLTFTPNELDELQLTEGFDVPLPLYEAKGETISKIMGFASETSIEIVSDTPNPVNITQIELKGRFTGKSSGFVR